MRPPLRAVLLDVDDTLIDTEAAMLAAAAASFRELWPHVGEEAARATAVRFRADPEGHFRAFTRGETDFATMRAARVGAAARVLGADLPDTAGRAPEGAAGGDEVVAGPATMARWTAAYEPVFATALHAHPDALDLVHRARAAGLRVGTLTNSGAAYTADKLAATGLAGLVGEPVTRDTLGFGKPDPRVFHLACERLGVTPAQTLYVGDEWEPDVAGALAAGLRPVWLRRRPEAGDRGRADAAGVLLVRSLSGVPLATEPAKRFGRLGEGR